MGVVFGIFVIAFAESHFWWQSHETGDSQGIAVGMSRGCVVSCQGGTSPLGWIAYDGEKGVLENQCVYL